MRGPVKVKALSLSESRLELEGTWSMFPYTGRTDRPATEEGLSLIYSPPFSSKSGITGEEMRRASARLAGRSILGCVG